MSLSHFADSELISSRHRTTMQYFAAMSLRKPELELRKKPELGHVYRFGKVELTSVCLSDVSFTLSRSRRPS